MVTPLYFKKQGHTIHRNGSIDEKGTETNRQSYNQRERQAERKIE